MKWNSPQTLSALTTLASGIILCYIAFFMSSDQDVPEGVLWYFGQALIYAGSVFGLKVYVDNRTKK